MHSLAEPRAHAQSLPHHQNPPFACADLARPGVEVGASRRVGPGFALGLDSSQTSLPPLPHQMQDHGFLRVDHRLLKVKKARYATLTGSRLHMAERPNWAGTFVGLTYADEDGYNPKDISVYMGKVRKWCDKHGIECRYVWVAEMQKRGVIHYHLIIFHPKRLNFPKPDKSGMWPHGSSNRRVGIKRAAAYMAKYMSKGDAAAFPKGARTYGCGGLDGTGKVEMRYWKLPTWVRDIVNPSRPEILTEIPNVPKRVLGGFASVETGEFYASPWQVYFNHGNIYIKRKETLQ